MTEDTSPEKLEIRTPQTIRLLQGISDKKAVKRLIEALKNRTDTLLENRDHSISSQNSLDWGFSGSAKFPRAEVSSGTRAKCFASEQKIMKGELQIAVEKFGFDSDSYVIVNVGYILAKNFKDFFFRGSHLNLQSPLSGGMTGLDRAIENTRNRIDPWPRVFLDTENWENTVYALIENSQCEISTKHRKKTYPPLTKEKLHELNELFGGTIGSYYHIVKALVKITEKNIKGKEKDNIIKFLKSDKQGTVMMGASMLKGILEE